MTKTKTNRRILKVTIRREIDECPDLSWIGEYSNRPGDEDKTIDRKERGDCGRLELPYFIATNSAADTGNPESVDQDYRRMEDYGNGWVMVGVWIEAEVTVAECGRGSSVIQRIRSGGLWGIESDSSDEFFAEVEAEEFTQLRAELSAMGFSKSAITRAFNAAERKE